MATSDDVERRLGSRRGYGHHHRDLHPRQLGNGEACQVPSFEMFH